MAMEKDSESKKPAVVSLEATENNVMDFNIETACKSYAACDPVPEDIKAFQEMTPVGKEL